MITMCISLYTSRVILNALGVEDFGVYNVVGGFVALCTIFTNSLSRAYSRFIAVAIAHSDISEQRSIFSASINILLFLTIVIVLIFECIGLWYFPTVANIPADRKDIILPLFQMSMALFVINLNRIPSISFIIASEHSRIFALMGILESILKLLVVYLLYISPFDKLLYYAFLLIVVSIVMNVLYSVYCYRHYNGYRYEFFWKKVLYLKLLSFSSWSFVGISASTLNSQGLILIINKFLGVTVNAACGIVSQLNACLSQFVTNVAVAVNPQIIKAFTQGDLDYAKKLIVISSKSYSFIVLLYAIPVLVEANMLIRTWLGFVPDYTVPLLRIQFLTSIFLLMANPFKIAAQATGNIKRMELITSLFYIMELPVAYYMLFLGASVEIVYLLTTLVNGLALLIQIWVIRSVYYISIRSYIRNDLLKVLLVAILSCVIPFMLTCIIAEGWLRLLVISLSSVLITLFIEYYIGLNKSEKYALNSIININKYLKWIKR